MLAGLIAVVGSGEEEEQTGCWPDNWPVVLVFDDLSSQWNIGMGGAVGLKYEAIQMLFELHGIERWRRRELFDGLRVMERAALQEINKR